MPRILRAYDHLTTGLQSIRSVSIGASTTCGASCAYPIPGSVMRAWSPPLPWRGDERGELATGGDAWRDPIRDRQLQRRGRDCRSTKTDRASSTAGTADTAHCRQSMRGNGYGAYGRCCAFLAKCFEMLGQSTADRKVRHMYGAYGKYYAFWTKSLSPARMRERVLSKTHVICRNLPYYSGLVNLISNLKVRQIDVMCRTDWVVLTQLMPL